MSQTLTVATYNVHEWIGRDRIEDPLRTLKIIEELNADIIALQEVSLSTVHGDRICLNDLTRITGMQAIPGPTLFKAQADYGNVLLSRYPPTSLKSLDISVKGREPRGAIISEFDLGYIRIKIIATHLGLWNYERRIQLRCLAKEMARNDSNLLILMGDLNEWNPVYSFFKSRFSWFGKISKAPTYPSRFPIFSLDQIMVRPYTAIKCIKVHKSALARDASDHLPLSAELDITFLIPNSL